VVEVLWSAFWR